MTGSFRTKGRVMLRNVTTKQAEAVLGLVAAWMGQRGYTAGLVCAAGCAGATWLESEHGVLGAGDLADAHQDATDHGIVCLPAPTGEDAAYNGTGPVLRMDFYWSGSETPTVVLEGGPYDWAIEVGEAIRGQCKALGVWTEPYSGWALSIHPLEEMR